MSDLSPETRLRLKAGAHRSWANTADRRERTEPARRAFHNRFERLVDPDGVMDPTERAIRAESARKAWYIEFAAKGVAARQAKK